MHLTELKATYWQGCIFGGSREESVSLFFQILGAAQFPWLETPFHLQSQLQLLSSFRTLILIFLPPSSTFKDFCDYIGPTQIIQDNVPILKSTN